LLTIERDGSKKVPRLLSFGRDGSKKVPRKPTIGAFVSNRGALLLTNASIVAIKVPPKQADGEGPPVDSRVMLPYTAP
jgi:hypothetical protein